MDEFDGIIAAGRQARRALGDIFVVIHNHGWAFYRQLSFEQFALLFILLAALLGPLT